ncbi:MAG TPA: low molecular weight protein-tyrosine-phosphatase, partial [Balneolaceae bacterium]|nr:low molecular weight protein-tyrosine-phosphatase [Balneolaceae bacterium]
RGLQAYFEIDSAGTSAYHSGQSADENAQKVANKNNIELHSKARRLEQYDLGYFDLIVAMYFENFSNIKQLDEAQNYGDKVVLLREFDSQPEDKEVPDPYFGGIEGFENVFDIVKRSCEKLLDELNEKIK